MRCVTINAAKDGFISKCVQSAKPSWGYIYLANIIAHNYFNVIFTPNFDDLLNEACFLYADCRPIVCAHDSAVADIRVTSARPKIIKLHGDFLYDSIKNTVRETETLEKNMRDKFIQFAREYGLVVIGYGGNDRSIMDILNMLLLSEGCFPNGLYWCSRERKGGRAGKKLARLMRRENAYWVAIKGFNEFMAELHENLGLKLPDTVRDPYKATTERLNRFISLKKVKHPIIKKAIADLDKQVKSFEQIISGKATTEDLNRLLPSRFLGDKEFHIGKYHSALSYYEKALIQHPNDLTLRQQIFYAYVFTEQFKKALRMSEQTIKQVPTDFRGYFLKGRALVYLGKLKTAIRSFNRALKYTAEKSEDRSEVLISRSNVHLIAGSWEKALLDAEKALQIEPEEPAAAINKCNAMKKLGKGSEADKILKDILSEVTYAFHRACAFALLGDKKNMLKELKKAITKVSGLRVYARFDPDFAEYQEDSDFRKLVDKDNRQKKKRA